MGTMHRVPTLRKIKKYIDSHFHGNDSNDKKAEEMCGVSSPLSKGRREIRFLVFFC